MSAFETRVREYLVGQLIADCPAAERVTDSEIVGVGDATMAAAFLNVQSNEIDIEGDDWSPSQGTTRYTIQVTAHAHDVTALAAEKMVDQLRHEVLVSYLQGWTGPLGVPVAWQITSSDAPERANAAGLFYVSRALGFVAQDP